MVFSLQIYPFNPFSFQDRSVSNHIIACCFLFLTPQVANDISPFHSPRSFRAEIEPHDNSYSCSVEPLPLMFWPIFQLFLCWPHYLLTYFKKEGQIWIFSLLLLSDYKRKICSLHKCCEIQKCIEAINKIIDERYNWSIFSSNISPTYQSFFLSLSTVDILDIIILCCLGVSCEF